MLAAPVFAPGFTNLVFILFQMESVTPDGDVCVIKNHHEVPASCSGSSLLQCGDLVI